LLHKWGGGYLNSSFPHVPPNFVKRKGTLKGQFENSKILFDLSIGSAAWAKSARLHLELALIIG
jgi:hypothetical protein